ncbi:Putative adhesin [Desulfotomaculum arcticum]|uniref:Putative adhesin n=1 Tax=Desulfotruncus arcticus DSM 17038 TaxID=1121424 RepID=A0A1I2UGH2_9FIRM|nr:DUF4097 family beta strand repeat-containing protein [Desulfotruncus arcticus]SFG76235.1 Putative adhesin [Desulfotomaculum arcticum] [Desulfotruncus arcticus DSM 17038]
MAAKGMSKAGPVTLALVLVLGGLALLLYNFGALSNPGWLWKLWPLALIGVGLEYFIKKAVNRDVDVHFHVPSVLLIVFVIFAGGALYAISNVGRNLDSFFDGFPLHQARLDYSRSWTSDPVEVKDERQLLIQNETGRVVLKPAPGRALGVEAIIQSPDNGPARQAADSINPAIKREGAVITVSVPQTENQAADRINNYIVTDLVVAVPSGLDVRVESGTGRVQAQNIDAALAINGNTGTVELSDIKGDITVDNNTGRVEVRNPGGNVTADTNTGSIELYSDNPLAGNYHLQSSTGVVSMQLPKGSDLSINAESRTGKVTVWGLPEHQTSAGANNQYSYKFGSGKGLAELTVGTGAVKITVK